MAAQLFQHRSHAHTLQFLSIIKILDYRKSKIEARLVAAKAAGRRRGRGEMKISEL